MLKGIFILEGPMNCYGSHVDVITMVVQLSRFGTGVKRKVDQRWPSTGKDLSYLIPLTVACMKSRKHPFQARI